MNSKKQRPVIVAVDGPAGSGKSTICSVVCKDLGWSYVNTGALYRAVGLIAQDRRVDLQNGQAVGALIEKITPEFHWDHDSGRLFLGSVDLTPRLGTPEAGAAASFVAKQPQVRSNLLPLQRSLSLMASSGAIVDGRDIGTVVFPDADLKVFLTASLEERAKRRWNQFNDGSTHNLTLAAVMEEIEQRDQQDRARGTAPMRQAEDAVEFDTTGCDLETAVQRFKNLLKEKLS